MTGNPIAKSDGSAGDAYSPLWHLQRINWVKESKAADDDQHKSLVALIDNGTNIDHPYLANQTAGALAVDFASALSGIGYSTNGNNNGGAHNRKPITGDTLNSLGLAAPTMTRLTPVLDQLIGSSFPELGRNSMHRLFPSHGTACSGIVCAYPPGHDDGITDACYVGVDYNCNIMPINTSFNPSADQLIAAFIYAYAQGADVILCPRGFATDWKVDLGEYDNPLHTARTQEDFDNREQLWLAAEELVGKVAQKIPVVFAAGNSGENTLSYPASLSRGTESNGIISVGALAYSKYRSGYSNYGDDLTLVAPSNDEEVFNRHQVRLDEHARGFRFHDYQSYTPNIAKVPYSQQAILTTDIPGRAGYFSSSEWNGDSIGQMFDPMRGMFTLFGGTSAASAIVAGVASRVVRAAKQAGNPLSGIDVKKILQDTSSRDGLHDDVMDLEANGQAPTSNLLFGEGLVNMGAALSEVENSASS